MFGTADGGGTWTASSLPTTASGGAVVDVACSWPKTCVTAVNLGSGPNPAAIYVSTDRGETWSAGGALPPGFQPADGQGLSCTKHICVMVGGIGTTAAAVVSSDWGQTWTSVPVPPALAILNAVSCQGGHCIAVGKVAASPGNGSPYGQSLVIVTNNSGQSWQVANDNGLPSADVWTLACTSAANCWVGGALLGPPSHSGYGFVAQTHDSGTSWVVPTLPNAPSPAQQAATGLTQLNFVTVTSITCPSNNCVALATQASVAQPDLRQAILTSS